MFSHFGSLTSSKGTLYLWLSELSRCCSVEHKTSFVFPSMTFAIGCASGVDRKGVNGALAQFFWGRPLVVFHPRVLMRGVMFSF